MRSEPAIATAHLSPGRFQALDADALVEVHEPFTFNTLATIGTGGSATYLTIDGEENKLYVVNAPRRTVQIVNLVNYQVDAEFDVGEQPYRTALMGER